MDGHGPSWRQGRGDLDQHAHRGQVDDRDVVPRRHPAPDRPRQVARQPAPCRPPLGHPRHRGTQRAVARSNSKMRTRPVAPRIRTANCRPSALARYNVPDVALPVGANARIDEPIRTGSAPAVRPGPPSIDGTVSMTAKRTPAKASPNRTRGPRT